MLRTLTLTAMMMLTAFAVQAEVVEIDIPGSTERLLIDLPEGWTEAHRETKDAQTLIEYIPGGQTVENWDDMITVTLLTRKMPGENPHENLAKLWAVIFGKTVCREEPKNPAVTSSDRNGFPAAAYSLGCLVKPIAKQVPQIYVRDYELISGLVINGNDGIYQVQRAWHTDEFKINDAGMIEDGYAAAKKIAAVSEETSSFVQRMVLPCDTAKSDRPCTAPPEN